MAYVKITDLPAILGSNVEDGDVLMLDDISVPESFKITIAELRSKLLEEYEEESYFLSLYTS